MGCGWGGRRSRGGGGKAGWLCSRATWRAGVHAAAQRTAAAHLLLAPLELVDPLTLRLRRREGRGGRLRSLLALVLPSRKLRLALDVPLLRRGRRLCLALPLRLRLRLAHQRLSALLLLLAPARLLRCEQRRLLRRERPLLLGLPRLKLLLLPLPLRLLLPLHLLLRQPPLLLARPLSLRLLPALLHPPRLLARPSTAVVRLMRLGCRRHDLRLHRAGQPVKRLDVLHEALPLALAIFQRGTETRKQIFGAALLLRLLRSISGSEQFFD